MIVVRTPFRISFAGGGSDLPEYYRRDSGAVVSATINKYMYIAIHPYFHSRIRIKYSRTEDVDRVEDIQHPIVRECLSLRKIAHGVELASFADVPAGTGLGSSSAFTVGLLHALQTHHGEQTTPEQLARAACEVEIGRLGEPIGKQDQYAAAYGGLSFMRFHSDESVEVEPVHLAPTHRLEFERRLLLFYVGQERQARDILREQARNMANPEQAGRVREMVKVTEHFRVALERERFSVCGDLLNEGWILKRQLAGGISSELVDSTYHRALRSGAAGGKLLGAGGGGFLLLYCEPHRQEELRAELTHLREMPFRFSAEGSQIIYSNNCDSGGICASPSFAMETSG